jgi:hypothetical protein
MYKDPMAHLDYKGSIVNVVARRANDEAISKLLGGRMILGIATLGASACARNDTTENLLQVRNLREVMKDQASCMTLICVGRQFWMVRWFIS